MECVVGFPQGIEFIPWMMAGGDEIADATAVAFRKRSMAMWQHHGVFARGRNLDAAFGLIHMADKAAGIYLKAMAAGGMPLRAVYGCGVPDRRQFPCNSRPRLHRCRYVGVNDTPGLKRSRKRRADMKAFFTILLLGCLSTGLAGGKRFLLSTTNRWARLTGCGTSPC